MVILDPEIDERTVAPSLDKFLNVIRNDGGTIDSVDIWGRRRLAYEINKDSRTSRRLVQRTANASATVELDRQRPPAREVLVNLDQILMVHIAQVAEAKKAAD